MNIYLISRRYKTAKQDIVDFRSTQTQHSIKTDP